MKAEKLWVTNDPITPEASKELSDYHPVLRQILYNREARTAAEAESFLKAEPPVGADPYLLPGMDTAVKRILDAIQNGEAIVVYGDYDADGVTATALMVQTLKALDARVEPYIPNRFEEGYGLNTEALDDLKARGTDLVITVDCGIRALAEASHARAIGLDLVITDHHSTGPELPDALAVVNPKRSDSSYPARDLAGVGTAYKLACALISKAQSSEIRPEDLLDLVAIGTVADLVPLKGENRALVRTGLEQMRRPRRLGLTSLIGVVGINPDKIVASNIGFGLGPRLNAAGRLDSALAAYRLLTSEDSHETGILAQQLDNQNRERQQITRDMQQLADTIAIPDGIIPPLLFAADPSFNAGVVGLAASRLTEKYYRPAIVGHTDEETTRASCRSIPEFDITNALDQCADLLMQYGGHAAAAGFTVANDRLSELIDRLIAIAEKAFAGKDLRPTALYDAEVPFTDLNLAFIETLDQLQPTGHGNPEPIFVCRGLKAIERRAVGKDGAHLKLTFEKDGYKLGAIAFRQGHRISEIPESVDVLFNFERNEFKGSVSPQLNVRDLRASE